MEDETKLKKQIEDKIDGLTNQGSLFNSINYQNSEVLEQFIFNLTYEQSLYVLSEAIKYAHVHGVFNLVESEILSKAIRNINK